MWQLQTFNHTDSKQEVKVGIPKLFVVSVAAGQQNRGEITGGARSHHDLSEVQHPEVLPGGRHHTMRSPRRHGCQRLLRPLRKNVSGAHRHSPTITCRNDESLKYKSGFSIAVVAVSVTG